MTSSKRQKRLNGWKRPLKGMSVFVFLALVTAGTAYAVWYWRAATALEAEFQKIADAGQPLRLDDFFTERIDPAEDAGPILREALEKYRTPDNAFFVLITAQPPTQPGDYRAFRDALELNEESLRLLRKGVQKSHCRLTVGDDGNISPDRPMRHVLKSVRLAELLRARSLQSLGTKEHQTAIDSVVESLRLSILLRDEPFLLSQAAGQSIAAQALSSLQEVLGTAGLDDKSYSVIDRLLMEMEKNSRMKTSVLAERAMVIDSFEALLAGVSLNPAGKNGKNWWNRPLLSRPVILNGQAFSMRVMTELANAIDRDGPPGAEAITAINEKIDATPYVAAKLLLPRLSGVREWSLNDRQRLILARFAMRIDRYRHEHGMLPKSLVMVCDRDLPKVAPDLLWEQPLEYETHETGFTIQSHRESNSAEENSHVCRFEVVYPTGGALQEDADASTQE